MYFEINNKNTITLNKNVEFTNICRCDAEYYAHICIVFLDNVLFIFPNFLFIKSTMC